MHGKIDRTFGHVDPHICETKQNKKVTVSTVSQHNVV